MTNEISVLFKNLISLKWYECAMKYKKKKTYFVNVSRNRL